MRKWQPYGNSRSQNVWTEVQNMYPTDRGTYKSASGYSTLSGATGGPASPGTTLNAWCALLPTGAHVGYVGTSTKLYSTTDFLSFTDRTLSGGYSAGSDGWSFAQFGSFTLATNGVNQIQVRDASGSGAFANLGGSPPSTAKILVVQANAVLAFNLNSGGDEWVASDVGNHANWTTGEAVAATKILHRPGGITAAIAFRDVVLVAKRSSVYLMRYVGSPLYWTAELLTDSYGCRSRHDMVNCGDYVILMGDHGAALWDGAQFRDIDEGFELSTAGSAFWTSGDSGGSSASNYWPGDRTAAFYGGALFKQTLVYNLRADAWGNNSVVNSSGTAYSGYVPLTGDPAARRSVVGNGASLNGGGQFYVNLSTNPTTIKSGSNVQLALHSYITTGFVGLGDEVMTRFSRVQPILIDSNADFTAVATGGLLLTAASRSNTDSNGVDTADVFVPTGATWNPNDKGPQVTLSNGNLTANINCFSSQKSSVRSTTSIIAGSWYMEYSFISPGGLLDGSQGVGIANDTMSTSTAAGEDNNAIAYLRDGRIRKGGATLTTVANYFVGDVIAVLANKDSGEIKFYKNNAVVYTATNVPIGSNWYAVARCDENAVWTVTANFGGSSFTYSNPAAPPVNFVAGQVSATKQHRFDLTASRRWVKFKIGNAAPGGFWEVQDVAVAMKAAGAE